MRWLTGNNFKLDLAYGLVAGNEVIRELHSRWFVGIAEETLKLVILIAVQYLLFVYIETSLVFALPVGVVHFLLSVRQEYIHVYFDRCKPLQVTTRS